MRRTALAPAWPSGTRITRQPRLRVDFQFRAKIGDGALPPGILPADRKKRTKRLFAGQARQFALFGVIVSAGTPVELRAYALLAFASVACGGQGSSQSTAAFYRATCAGPAATLSLGPYPAGTDDLVKADSALTGTIVTLNQLPASCGGTLNVGDTFRLDSVVWGDTPAQSSLGLSFEGPMAIHYFALGEHLMYLGASSGIPCALGPSVIDLTQYPHAVADMLKLRTFVANRDVYAQLIAAQVIADAVVVSLGPQQTDPTDSGQYHVALTLDVRRTLCGASSAKVTAEYLGFFDQGVANSAGNLPPTLGTELIFLLGASGSGSPPTYNVSSAFPQDLSARLDAEWSLFAGLLESPPSLSL